MYSVNLYYKKKKIYKQNKKHGVTEQNRMESSVTVVKIEAASFWLKNERDFLTQNYDDIKT